MGEGERAKTGEAKLVRMSKRKRMVILNIGSRISDNKFKVGLKILRVNGTYLNDIKATFKSNGQIKMTFFVSFVGIRINGGGDDN